MDIHCLDAPLPDTDFTPFARGARLAGRRLRL
jgi:hypothetical protein